MVYTIKDRIKYHQVDSNQKLDICGLLEMFQDCGALHGEDCGFSIDYQNEIGKCWVITSWQLIIDKLPRLGDEVVVSTWGYKVRQIMALRNFTLSSPDGEIFAKADTQWIMMDMNTGRPTRVPQEAADMYGMEPDMQLPDEFPGRSIKVAPEGEYKESLLVAEHMLDTNGHVNNCQYVQIARSYVPKDLKFKRFGAEYVAQAFLGDTMKPRVSTLENGGFQVVLEQENGKPYLIAQWD